MPKYLFFCCLFLLVGKVSAQSSLFVLRDRAESHLLNGFTRFCADSSGQEGGLQALPSEPLFVPFALPAHDPVKGYTYWYRLRLTNQLPDKTDFVLEVANFELLEFYVFKNQTLIDSGRVGKRIPPGRQGGYYAPHLVPLKLLFQDTVHIVVKATALAYTQQAFTDIRLQDREIVQVKFLTATGIQLFFQGAMLLMSFYNLLFFFVVRDRAYLYYALYILCMALVSVEAYTWTRQVPYTTSLITTTVALLITICYVQFVRYFLNIPRLRPVVSRYFDYWVYFHLVISLSALLFYYPAPDLLLENKLILSMFMLDMLVGVWFVYIAWKANPVLAVYILIGYLAMTLPLSVAILKQILLDGADPQTDGIIVQAGVLIELISFSLGLGYRSKAAEQERLHVSEENRRIIKEQNVVLEQRVKERTEALHTTLQTVSKQRDDIVSSINYALRIQNAIIPKESELQKHLDCFAFFRPKDIVSGDFYWFAQKGDTKILAVGDCTGHGVSGAFMTMIGNDMLRHIVHDMGISAPDQILNCMPSLLEKTLQHAEGSVSDGMDIAIVAISGLDDGSRLVAYSGAMNPLYHVHEGILSEIKADKRPIGGRWQADFAYQCHLITIPAGGSAPTFYLCSDGFQDQFGGEANRKFMVKNLKKLLTDMAQKPLPEQKKLLTETFDQWKKEEEQTDDVLVVGLRLG